MYIDMYVYEIFFYVNIISMYLFFSGYLRVGIENIRVNCNFFFRRVYDIVRLLINRNDS